MKPTKDQRLADFLEHMLEAINRIGEYTQDMNFDEFEGSPLTQDAVIRNFEIIGEASRNIQKRYPEFIDEHTDVPWIAAYEMRNALSHGYFAVDLHILWRTIQNNLPNLERQVDGLLAQVAKSHPS